MEVSQCRYAPSTFKRWFGVSRSNTQGAVQVTVFITIETNEVYEVTNEKRREKNEIKHSSSHSASVVSVQLQFVSWNTSNSDSLKSTKFSSFISDTQKTYSRSRTRENTERSWCVIFTHKLSLSLRACLFQACLCCSSR